MVTFSVCIHNHLARVQAQAWEQFLFFFFFLEHVNFLFPVLSSCGALLYSDVMLLAPFVWTLSTLAKVYPCQQHRVSCAWGIEALCSSAWHGHLFGRVGPASSKPHVYCSVYLEQSCVQIEGRGEEGERRGSKSIAGLLYLQLCRCNSICNQDER